MNRFEIRSSAEKKSVDMNIDITPVIGIAYGLCIGVVIANVPFPSLGISLGTLLYPMVSLTILTVCLHKMVISPKQLGRFKWILLSFFIFASYLILMSVWGQNKIQNMRFLFTLPLLPIITYVLTYSFKIGKQVKFSFFLVLLCGCIYTISVSFHDVRAQGMTAGENSTGVVLVLGFIFALWLQESSTEKLHKWFFGVCAFLFIYGIFVTGSRTSYLIFLICSVMILYHRGKSKKGLMIIKGILILILVSVLIFMQKDRYQFQRVLGAVEILSQGESEKPGNRNVNRRMQKDKIALEIFKANLLFGIGYSNKEVIEDWYGEKTRFSHNTYLRLLSETGLIGFFLYFCFLFSIFQIARPRNGLKLAQNKKPEKIKNFTEALTPYNPASFWLTCGFVGIVVSSFFIVMFNEKIFWIWLSLIVAEQALHAKKNIN